MGSSGNMVRHKVDKKPSGRKGSFREKKKEAQNDGKAQSNR